MSDSPIIYIASDRKAEREVFQKVLLPFAQVFTVSSYQALSDGLLTHSPAILFFRPFINTRFSEIHTLRGHWRGALGLILDTYDEVDKYLDWTPCALLIGTVSESAIYAETQVLLKRRQALQNIEVLNTNFQAYSSIFERAGVGVAQVEAQTGTFIRVNQKYREMLGYTSEEIERLQVKDISFEEDMKQDLKYMDAIEQGNLNEIAFERRLIKKSGEDFWAHITISPMWNEGDVRRFYVVIVKNINRRKTIEYELAESERRLEQMFRHHDAVMLLIEPESGQIIDANKAAIHFYGYSNELITQMSVQDINLLTEAEVIEEMQAARSEKRNYFIFQHQCANGEIRTVEVHSTPFEMKEKKYLFSIIHDITEKQKSQKTLQEKEEQYRQLFENAPIGIGVINSSGELLNYNDSLLTPGNYTPQDIEQLGRRVNVERLYKSETERDKVVAAFQTTGYLFRQEVQFKEKSGQAYDVLLSLVPTEFQEEPCILAFAEDITEFKRAEQALTESEARYRLIVETAEEGIILVDQQNNITFMNQKMSQMLGINHPEETLHLSLFEFVNQAEYETLFFTDGDPQFKQRKDIKLKTRTGCPLWVNMSMSFIYTPEQKYLGMLAMVTDITHLKENEEKIQKALDERELLLKEIHHRVKNNFQVIISLLNLQMRKLEKTSTYKPLQVSKQRIQSMALVHEKMYQSQEMGKINFAEYLMLLTQELYATEVNLSSGIQLKFDLEPLFLEFEQAIPAALIVNELVSNAYKYAFLTPIKSPLVQVSLKYNEEIILEVKDNGSGFASAKQESLGLQLVDSLVKQLEGSCEKQKTEGTHWIISFPLLVESKE